MSDEARQELEQLETEYFDMTARAHQLANDVLKKGLAYAKQKYPWKEGDVLRHSVSGKLYIFDEVYYSLADGVTVAAINVRKDMLIGAYLHRFSGDTLVSLRKTNGEFEVVNSEVMPVHKAQALAAYDNRRFNETVESE